MLRVIRRTVGNVASGAAAEFAVIGKSCIIGVYVRISVVFCFILVDINFIKTGMGVFHIRYLTLRWYEIEKMSSLFIVHTQTDVFNTIQEIIATVVNKHVKAEQMSSMEDDLGYIRLYNKTSHVTALVVNSDDKSYYALYSSVLRLISKYLSDDIAAIETLKLLLNYAQLYLKA